MRSLCLLALASLALVCGPAKAIDEESKQLLGQLCQNKKHAPAVTRVEEVKSLIKLLKDDPSAMDCDAEVAEAIKALEPVVELKSVCSEPAADTIVAFWKNFVRSKAGGRKHLPAPLREFFIAYGLQASKQCKIQLMEQLEKATQTNQISRDDIKLVTEAIEPIVGKIFGDDLRPENLFVMIQAYKKSDEEKGTLNMEPLKREIFERVRERCINKFKPIYDTLITPVVRLASIGLTYKGASIDSRLADFQREQLYKDWFVAVLACESSSKYNVVSVPKELMDESGNKKLINFLDEDDIEQLKKQGLAVEEPKLVEPLDYALVAPLASDLVVDNEDADLISSMGAYRSILKEMNKFRLRLLRRLPMLMKTYVDAKAVQWGLSGSKKGKKLSKFGKLSQNGFNWLMFLVFFILTSGAITGYVFAMIATQGTAHVLVFVLGGLLCLALATITLILFDFAIRSRYD